MTDDIFRKIDTSDKQKNNEYEPFGFKQNPFPTKPSVNIGSSDLRENGSIYLAELRQKEQQTFEQLLIPHSSRSQVKPIAFLMDYATRRGRGIGKTAFLQHQCKRINSDFGKELSDNTEVMFSVYVLPAPDGKSRKFWQFHKLLVHSLVSRQLSSVG